MLHIPASRLAICLKSMAIAPVIILAAAIWIIPQNASLLAHIMVAYGAMWLAGAGGAHWGFCLNAPDTPTNIYRYLYAFMPIPFGVVLVVSPPSQGLFFLFLGFLLTLNIDRKTLNEKSLNWYITIRAVTTLIWCVCLYAAYMAL